MIPALIRKFLEAKQSGAQTVVCWGDGSPTREFLFVDDAARGWRWRPSATMARSRSTWEAARRSRFAIWPK